MKKEASINRARKIFVRHKGILRTSEAINQGIHPRVLYQMREQGLIQQMSRGLYRLKTETPLSNPDFAQVAIKIPKAVICLISALAFHRLTTEIPHEVSIALKKDDYPPKLEYPPVRVFWFSDQAYAAGIESLKTDGVSFRIYSAEKTIVDCFKFRNKIGLNVATEALRLYTERKKLRLNEIERFAKICRVQNVIRPYLEALL
jgi:predicted transcriptional regulator of viral defense system